jgi:hypothetical protein
MSFVIIQANLLQLFSLVLFALIRQTSLNVMWVNIIQNMFDVQDYLIARHKPQSLRQAYQRIFLK